jgi:hypothetical protein
MFAVVAALAASSAFAHGPQIQLTFENDKITTRNIVAEEPYSNSLTYPTSVYVIRLSTSPATDPTGVFYVQPNNTTTSGPGLAYGYDQADGGPPFLQAGSHFTLHLPEALRIWNGSGFVPTATEQIGFRRTGSPLGADTAITGAVPASANFPDITHPYNTGSPAQSLNAHSSARFRLLGAGGDPLAATADGVYLLELQLSSTQTSPVLAPSDPFYFLLHKNASPGEIDAALAGLLTDLGLGAGAVQIIPEPSTWLLAATFLAAAASARRREAC